MKKYITITLMLTTILIYFLYTNPQKKYNIPIEKIYVINLNKDTSRLEKISNSLRSQNLNFERFPAILGIDLKIKDENGKIFTGMDLKTKKVKFRLGELYKVQCPNITLNYKYKPAHSIDGLPLTAGEFGVYCSHLEIMLDSIRNKYKSVLVFEDDSVVPHNLSSELQNITTQMPNWKKFDIIYLGYGISSNKKIDYFQKVKNIPFNSAIQKITNHDINLGSVHAIIYGYWGAKRIIDALENNIHAGIDLDLFRELNKNSNSKVFKAKNLNILQDNTQDSSIVQMGRII